MLEFASSTCLAPALEEFEMFNNLIESNAHTAEFKRRGSFLMATMFAYALFFMAAGVVSIYAYEAHVDNQSLELTALVTMVPLTEAPPKSSPPRAAHQPTRSNAPTDSTALVSTRAVRQSSVNDMTRVPDKVGVTGNNAPPALPDSVIGKANIDVGGGRNSSGLPFDNNNGTGGTPNASSGGNNELTRDAPPEMPAKETRPSRPKLVSLGVIESKVLRKAVPPYPELAKRARASGPVPVQILLDEQGRVISARATSGHPLLRPAAEQAAYQTRFSPTLLSNQPVKVSGVITFTFVLQ